MGKIGHHFEKMSPDHRVSTRRSVLWRQVLLYILYVDWYRSEDSWEERWVRSDYLWATQGPPNSQKCKFVILWPIYEKLVDIFFPCYMSALLWGLTAMKFSFTWVQHKGLPRPPKYDFFYFFHILGLNLKISYQIVSLFDMYIDMGERIAGKPDRPSPIIEDPLRTP